MDPLGFGLENFDAVGAWRTMDGKLPIDAAGTLPDGRKFMARTSCGRSCQPTAMPSRAPDVEAADLRARPRAWSATTRRP